MRAERNKLLIYSFLISFISLFGELHLTRLLSFKSWNHVIYIIISLALLGYGIGSNINIFRKKNNPDVIPWLIVGQGVLFTAACFGIGSLAISHLEWGSTAVAMISAYFMAILPFILAGYALTLVFINIGDDMFGTAYFADLLGAGLGIILFFPAIKLFGVYRSVEICAIFSIMLVWILYIRRYKYALAVICLGLAALLIMNEEAMKIPVERGKELGLMQEMQGHDGQKYNIVFSGWYPLGKVQIIEPANLLSEIRYMKKVGLGTFEIPLSPPPPYRYFINNGGAGTPAYNLTDEGMKRYGTKINLFSTPMEFPFLISGAGSKVFIIGTGGGRDIYTSLLHGAKYVVGAEINPLTYELMENGFLSYYTAGIYNRDNVHIFNVDGRTLAKNELARKAKYDLIMLNGVDTFSAVSNGAYTFAETYIYTQEAMDEYIRLLNHNGVLNLNRWHFKDYPKETLRLFIMAAHALRKNGIENPGKNLFYARNGAWGMLLVKKNPFTVQEQALLTDYLGKFPPIEIYYMPYYTKPVSNPFTDYINAYTGGEKTEKEFIREAPYDVSPVTDDRPFYFKYYKFKDIFKRWQERTDITPWGGYYAVWIQLIVLSVSFVMVVLFIILPVFAKNRQGIEFLPTALMTAYFASIGLAYIFIEITLMQKTTILFGSPIYPLGIIMGSMLIFTGIGSYITRKIDAEKIVGILLSATVALAAVILIIVIEGDRLIEFIFPFPFALNAILVSLASGIIGFILGFYFPAGIALWRKKNIICIPWSYAINSGSTVVSTMLSIIIAQIYGFNFVLGLSLVLYLTAFSVFAIAHRKSLS